MRVGINKTARAILNNSLGINGNNPACNALLYPMIEPRYKTPKAKIIADPIIMLIKDFKYDVL